MVFRIPRLNEQSSKRAIIAAINTIAARLNIRVRGKGVRSSSGPMGTNINIKTTGGTTARTLAYVVSSMTGGGYYKCWFYKPALLSANWNTDTALLDANTTVEYEVLNYAEMGTNKHRLRASDLILCESKADDSGVARWVGIEEFAKNDIESW